MSYRQGYEVIMHPVHASGALATHFGGEALLSNATTLSCAVWGPGYWPHKVHGVSIVITSAGALTATNNFQFQHAKPFTGSDTATIIANLALPTLVSLASGPRVIFDRVTTSVEILPGEAVRVRGVAAATNATRGICVLYVSPSFERQENVGIASGPSTGAMQETT